jgi:hypothetical protein
MFEKNAPGKKTGHNSGPPQQTYYGGSMLVMRYPLGKLFGPQKKMDTIQLSRKGAQHVGV